MSPKKVSIIIVNYNTKRLLKICLKSIYDTARDLCLEVGDSLLSTPKTVYDQSQSFQLKMPIVGILEETGTPDDNAVFVSIRTAWVIDGIGHGHEYNLINSLMIFLGSYFSFANKNAFS